MGSLCNYQEREQLEDYSKPVSNEVKRLIDCNLTFSVSHPASIKADFFITFQDEQCRIVENNVLRLAGEHVAEKAQQYMEVYLQEKEVQIGDFVVLKVDIEDFPFDSLGVLCAEVWPGGTEQLLSPLEEDIEEALEQAAKQEAKNLVITQINEQLGIPKQIAQKTLCRALLSKMEPFVNVVVLCSSQESVDTHISVMNNIKSQQTNSVKNDTASDYY